jgi:hypothetical protein
MRLLNQVGAPSHPPLKSRLLRTTKSVSDVRHIRPTVWAPVILTFTILRRLAQRHLPATQRLHLHAPCSLQPACSVSHASWPSAHFPYARQPSLMASPAHTPDPNETEITCLVSQLQYTVYRAGPLSLRTLLGTTSCSRMLELRPALSGAWRGRVCLVCADPKLKTRSKNIDVHMVTSNGHVTDTTSAETNLASHL